MKITLTSLILVLSIGVANASPGQTHYIKPLQANVYENPSKTSKVKFVVAIGRKVMEFGSKSGFTQVGIDKSGGRDGWIKTSDLSPTDADGMKY